MSEDIQNWLNVGLCLIGYLFIIVKSLEWLISLLLKQWDKRRKLSAKQRAVNELYDAFELDNLKFDSDMKITTKGGVVIMIYRKDWRAYGRNETAV